MKKTFLPAILALIVLGSCSSKKADEHHHSTNNDETVTTSNECTFTYDASSTQVLWTAFKHSTKTPVSGNLQAFEITASTSNHPLGVLKDATFKIGTAPSNINSNDTLRDRKISQFFFGVMTNTNEITASIKSLEEGNGQGSGVLILNVNDVKKELPLEYTVDGEKITLTASVNFEDWNGQTALASLNDKCAAKHTGEDGEKKLWPEVKIVVTTELNKACNY